MTERISPRQFRNAAGEEDPPVLFAGARALADGHEAYVATWMGRE
jgi:hypothetical protein